VSEATEPAKAAKPKKRWHRIAIELRQHREAHLARADQQRLARHVDDVQRPARLERHPRDDIEQVRPPTRPRRQEATEEPHDDERRDADSTQHQQAGHQQVAVTRRLATTRHARRCSARV
jgi:hypothetical protein